MEPAQQDEVVELRLAAFRPRYRVVRLRVARAAAREAAAPVSHVERLAEPPAHGASTPPHVQHRAVQAAFHLHRLRITGQPPRRSRGNVGPVLGGHDVAHAIAAGHGVDDQLHRCPGARLEPCPERVVAPLGGGRHGGGLAGGGLLLGGALGPVEFIGGRAQRLQEQGADLGQQPAPDLVHAVVRRPDRQVAAGGEFGGPVQRLGGRLRALPRAHEALHLAGRVVEGELDEPRLVLARGHAGQRPDLRPREAPPLHLGGGERERGEAAGRPAAARGPGRG